MHWVNDLCVMSAEWLSDVLCGRLKSCELADFKNRLCSDTLEIYFYSFSSILKSFLQFFNSFSSILKSFLQFFNSFLQFFWICSTILFNSFEFLPQFFPFFCNSFQFFWICSTILFNSSEFLLQFFSFFQFFSILLNFFYDSSAILVNSFSFLLHVFSSFEFPLRFFQNVISFQWLIFHSYFLLFCSNYFHFGRAILSTSFEFCSLFLSFRNGSLIVFLTCFVLGKTESYECQTCTVRLVGSLRLQRDLKFDRSCSRVDLVGQSMQRKPGNLPQPFRVQASNSRNHLFSHGGWGGWWWNGCGWVPGPVGWSAARGTNSETWPASRPATRRPSACRRSAGAC